MFNNLGQDVDASRRLANLEHEMETARVMIDQLAWRQPWTSTR